MSANIDGEVYGQLRVEFIAECKDHLADMESVLSNAETGAIPVAEAVDVLRRSAHTIKGLAKPFGFSLLSSIVHQFEEDMNAVGEINADTARKIQKYIDTMAACLLQNAGGGSSHAPSPKSLEMAPTTGGARADADSGELMIFAVTSSRTIYRKLVRELTPTGFTLVHVAHTPDVFELAVTHSPDIIIVSDVLDTLTGLDVVHALLAMPSTAHIPTLYMTSYDSSHPDVAKLKSVVPTILLGAGVEQEIERAITEIELKFKKNAAHPTAKAG
ncbi:MAG: Hpt domain-containing protein [Alphaproteobacteria bacterium]|nr:Hpt domain-containing protein [Alphaproteobacteria bacterium]MBF0249491.1 Hpt domain-containing protein [Alphaproteobacteria bacterium]